MVNDSCHLDTRVQSEGYEVKDKLEEQQGKLDAPGALKILILSGNSAERAKNFDFATLMMV